MGAQSGGRMVGLQERQLAQGKSPVWGGLWLALVVGVVAYLVSLVAGWNPLLTALRSAAVVYTFLAVVSIPGWIQSRRAGRIAPLVEPVGEAIMSVGLVWVAFFAGLDGLHSAGWLFVALMLFAAVEAFHGRRVFNARTAPLGVEGDDPVAVAAREMSRTYWLIAGVQLTLAVIAVFLLTRPT